MKEVLREIYQVYESNDEFKRKLENYARYIKSDDGKFIRDIFLLLKGSMLQTLLSAKYTNLTRDEKDVMQRTFYHICQLLDFLASPVGVMQEKKARQIHLNRDEKSSGKKGSKK